MSDNVDGYDDDDDDDDDDNDDDDDADADADDDNDDGDGDEDDNVADDRGPHFARACAAEMHVDMSEEPLDARIYK